METQHDLSVHLLLPSSHLETATNKNEHKDEQFEVNQQLSIRTVQLNEFLAWKPRKSYRLATQETYMKGGTYIYVIREVKWVMILYLLFSGATESSQETETMFITFLTLESESEQEHQLKNNRRKKKQNWNRICILKRRLQSPSSINYRKYTRKRCKSKEKNREAPDLKFGKQNRNWRELGKRLTNPVREFDRLGGSQKEDAGDVEENRMREKKISTSPESEANATTQGTHSCDSVCRCPHLI